nr:hypothetical protein [Petrotoga sp. 9PW.55.5.1]
MKLTLEQKNAHGGHPVLCWMMDNIFICKDLGGNIKANKEKPQGKSTVLCPLLWDLTALCNRLIKETHAVLMEGVRGQEKSPGEF